jgi:shikimate dehydrogenase
MEAIMKTATSYREELVGVFGFPVDENPTVVMMDAAFRSLGLPWRYLTLKVSPADLAAGIQGIRAMGFRGLNLTIPHKVEVLQYLDEVNADARIMGAVNTIYRDGERLIGANTDGKGFLKALRDDAHMDPAGRKFMILGAGGAARSICVELAQRSRSSTETQHAQMNWWIYSDETPKSRLHFGSGAAKSPSLQASMDW